MNRLIIPSLFALLAAACSGDRDGASPNGEGVANDQPQESGERKILHYRDPMGGPATSPVPLKDSMGMDYIPVYADEAADGDKPAAEKKAAGKGRILYYRDPMGGPATSPVPKKDSMGMDYIAVYENETADTDKAVAVPPETIQAIGVKTGAAQEATFGETVQAFGAVAENSRLQTIVSVRTEGWISDLKISAVGDAVKKGDLLFRLFSPPLVAASQDYLTARRAGSTERAASALKRLKALGVQEQAIAALRSSGVAEALPFFADRDGLVSTLSVRDGAYVEAGAEIVRIQDYGEVWVNAAIPEQDVRRITPGAAVHASIPGGSKSRSGAVDYVYPTLDPKTRTGMARIVFDNAAGVLKPGAFVDVAISVDAATRLAVPSEAILRNAEGAHVVLALGDGRFMPRDVETGIVAAGMTEIVAGLVEGDEIVVSGQFLIDSESNLRESLGKLTAPEHERHSLTKKSGASDDGGDK